MPVMKGMKAIKKAKKVAAKPASAMKAMKAMKAPRAVPAFVGAHRLRRRVVEVVMKATRNQIYVEQVENSWPES